jgi:integrase
LTLAVVRSLRERRIPATDDELADFELDVLSEFVLARHAAGLVDTTIRSDTTHLEQVRDWFGRPWWEMRPRDGDRYFGVVLRDAASATRAGRAHALVTYFEFLDIRYKIELHELTGHLIECPLDEMNRPRMSVDAKVRIPPTAAEIEELFAGWRDKLATCRKFAPNARNYAVSRLLADVGLRINEARMLDFVDVRWELGRFGKLDVRHGKGSGRKGPKQRLAPLINGADAVLAWYIENVLGQHIDLEHLRADRILHEAIAVDADPLHLATVFNLNAQTAIDYSEIARTLATSAVEEQLPASRPGDGDRPGRDSR